MSAFLLILIASIRALSQEPLDQSANSIEEFTSGYTPPTNSDFFGFSVSISNNTVVVGAFENDDGVQDGGAVYVFENPTEWWINNRTYQLFSSDIAKGDRFGYSVSISGETLVASSPSNGEQYEHSGSVYVFDKTKEGWKQTAKLTAPDPMERLRFGEDVAISGDTIVVSTINDEYTAHDLNISSGYVYVFEREDNVWIYKGYLKTSTINHNDYFGQSISIDGDTIAVGAPLDDKGGQRAGAAYVFQKPQNGWTSMTETAKLIASDLEIGDRFGADVSVFGNTIAIGSPQADFLHKQGFGAVYIYEKPKNRWTSITESAIINASNDETRSNGRFGKSVALYENTLVVSAPRHGQKAKKQGIIYVFERPGSGWSSNIDFVKLQASDGVHNNRIGFDLSIFKNIIVGGASSSDLAALNKDRVYLFQKPFSGWNNSYENFQLPAIYNINYNIIIAYFLTFVFALIAIKHYIQLQYSLREQKIATQKAKSAAQTERRFLTRMSHELRTPLNGIIGSLELLTLTHDEDKKLKLATAAQTTANTLLSLIGDVLDFSKISENEFEYHPTIFSLKALMAEVNSMMRAKIQQQNLKIHINIDPDIPEQIESDPNRIRQVLINLIGNSIKFTHSGGIFITVICESKSQQYVTIRFIVLDTGEGFDPDIGESLFHEFKQVERTSQSNQGTGLGLTISKHIVEKMDGEIGCNGYPGNGAIFWFSTPVKIIEKSISDQNYSNVAILLVRMKKQSISFQLEEWLKQKQCNYRVIHNLDSFPEDNHYDIVLVESDCENITSANAPTLMNHELTKWVFITDSVDPSIMFLSHKMGFHCVFQNNNTQHNWNLILPSKDQRNKKNESNHNIDLVNLMDKLNAYDKSSPLLFVDDSPTNRNITKIQLEELGLQSDLAENGLVAFEKTTSKQYSVIITDCSMPEMDGFEFSRKYRRWEEQNRVTRTPIIAMTANVVSGTKEECLSAGMDDYLPKPIQLISLIEMLMKWLKHKYPNDSSTTVLNDNQNDEYKVILNKQLEKLQQVLDQENFTEVKKLAYQTRIILQQINELKLTELMTEIEKSSMVRNSRGVQELFDLVKNEMKLKSLSTT